MQLAPLRKLGFAESSRVPVEMTRERWSRRSQTYQTDDPQIRRPITAHSRLFGITLPQLSLQIAGLRTRERHGLLKVLDDHGCPSLGDTNAIPYLSGCSPVGSSISQPGQVRDLRTAPIRLL